MYHLLKLNLARNSLRYIIREYKIKELYIPYYLCNVIRKSILKENCKPVFYHIDDNFLPENKFKKTDFILYPNYFGICNKNVEILEYQYPNLIIDNAHSFFSTPKGLACFNSARKFLPVINGSFLWTKKANYILKEDKNYFDLPKNESEFLKAENDFENYEVLRINNEVLNSLEKINTEKINNKRLLKFKEYHKQYSEKNLLKIDISSIQSPFCYPFLFENDNEADIFAQDLEKNNLKIYRYWDNLPENFNEYKFYRRLVPVPL